MTRNAFPDEISPPDAWDGANSLSRSSIGWSGGLVDLCLLVVICGLFLAFRLPLMYRQPGGMDEGDYAVPGYTILQDGIPRIPYVPSRNTEGFYYCVDEVLLLLPPLYFYWQAAFFSILPPSYGTARLASGTAAMIAVVLVYWIGRQLTGSRTAGLTAAGLYSLSRVCFFPAMSARPDMLCGMLGLAAVACWLRWRDGGRPGWLLATSAFLGLGGLTHPFAITYAVQIGVWALLVSEPPLRRLRNFSVLIIGALVAFSLWLVLIVPHYEVFRIQFFHTVLDRSAPGLLQRFVSPWEAIRFHAQMFLEHAEPIQAVLMFGALVVATVVAVRKKNTGALKLVVLTWSSVYLLVVFEGIHPTKGYWCYPGAWLFLCLGWCAALTGQKAIQLCFRMNLPSLARRTVLAIATACVILAMLPGSGIQAWIAHARHWNDPAYDAREFVQLLLDEVPADARVVVDPAYVLPFYLADRKVILAASHDLRTPDDYLPYDYYIASHESIADGFPAKMGSHFVKSLGDRDNLFACYAELYESEDVAGIRPAARQPVPGNPSRILP